MTPTLLPDKEAQPKVSKQRYTSYAHEEIQKFLPPPPAHRSQGRRKPLNDNVQRIESQVDLHRKNFSKKLLEIEKSYNNSSYRSPSQQKQRAYTKNPRKQDQIIPLQSSTKKLSTTLLKDLAQSPFNLKEERKLRLQLQHRPQIKNSKLPSKK